MEWGFYPRRTGHIMATIPQRPHKAPENREATGGSREGFERLLDSYTQSALQEGAMLKGRVLQVTDNEVIVDVGYKCEGLIPVHQFRDHDGQIHVRPGDEIDVTIERSQEREGYVLLSHEK